MPKSSQSRELIAEISAYLKCLFPINRSITGEGNRRTLRILRDIVPVELKEYPSGARAYDWEIPPEWNVREAWIKNRADRKLVDFEACNVHLVGYSRPFRGRLTFEQLQPHLHTRDDLPQAIPYRTSYYRDDWGFCLSHADFVRDFRDGEDYEVCVDTELKPGSLTIGELLIPGTSEQEFLISTYICHPSLANDNLSGTVLTAFLARELMGTRRNFSYRIIFVPETIGAIAYCAHHEAAMKAIDAGLVVTCVGGPGPFYTKRSFEPGHYINRLIEEALREAGEEFVTYPFDVHGSDERQYSSQGFRINVASIGRNRYYEYDYYHTSLDNLDYVKAENIAKTLSVYRDVIDRLEREEIYRNRVPCGEVMLSKHDLYPKTGGGLVFADGNRGLTELDLTLWLLFYSDGRTTLRQIAERIGAPLESLRRTSRRLREKGILEPVSR